MSTSFWSFLVFLLVMLDQSEGWWRRRRRRCSASNCALSAWYPKSPPCLGTCGEGTQVQRRYVTREASCGGSCPYELQRTLTCNIGCTNGWILGKGSCLCRSGYSGRCCTGVDGGWSSWRSWGRCSQSCGVGLQQRTRDCTSPPPRNGGRYCAGDFIQFQLCNTHHCPVPGGWSNWGKWTTCSASCGTGVQKRSRTCTQPRPIYGGKPCQGATNEKQNCNRQPCPVHGGWSGWREGSSCSKTCGTGFQRRYRTCTWPPPRFGGKYCDGTAQDTRKCHRQPCPGINQMSEGSLYYKFLPINRAYTFLNPLQNGFFKKRKQIRKYNLQHIYSI